MTARQALFDYLTGPLDLTGKPAERFTTPKRINGITVRTRNEARSALRSMIGEAIYFGRRPQATENLQAAVTLESLTSQHEYGLAGEELAAVEQLQVTVFTRYGDAARRCESIRDLIQLAVSGYCCDNWGDTYVGECTVETIASGSDRPTDGSDNWSFSQRLDLSIMYEQRGSPFTSGEAMAAGFVWESLPGAGADLRLRATPTIPAGAEWGAVQWTLRSGSASGPVLLSFQGPPAAPENVANVTGTFSQPSIDRAAYGLAGIVVYVTVTITDRDGFSATYSEGRQE